MNILSQSNRQQLLCYCDHCPNNTCIADQHGTCTAELLLEEAGHFTQKFYCYDQESPDDLMQKLMCNTNFSKTSNSLYRCCNSQNYCNQAKGFLPTIDEVKHDFLIVANVKSSTSNNSNESYTDIFDHFSNLPLEIKIALVVVAGILTVLLLAFIQKLINQARDRVPECDNQTDSNSNKTSSDIAVYDSNSMACKEPLLNSSCYTDQLNNQHHHKSLPNCPTTANSFIHPNPLAGPYMSQEKYLGRTHPTIAVSIGSAEPHRSKQDTSTGSGSGHPYLHQRSIINDIELRAPIGRGRYGVVYRGDYKGESVAVKIFADSSWEREAEIYQTSLLRHKNILGFIASDLKTEGSFSGFWIVTDYYYLGSLSDFMRTNTLVIPDAIRMAFSIASGLAHLHTEILGTQGKPAIAHRDIKSKNILVKNDGTCCIADLGMAARFNSKTNMVDLPTKPRLGTIRYLAPEILENKLNLMDFEAIKAADMYSLGLVFWEILRRTCYKHRSLNDLPELSFISMKSKTSPRFTRPPDTKAESVSTSPPLVSTPAPFSQLPLQAQEIPAQQQPNPPFTSKPDSPLVLDVQQAGPSNIFHSEIEKHFRIMRKNKEGEDGSSSEHLPELSGLPSTNESQSEKEQTNVKTTKREISDDSADMVEVDSIAKAGTDIIYEEKTVESSDSIDESSLPLDESSPEVSTADSISKISFDCESLAPPYEEYVTSQPTLAEMREIVCERKLRPTIIERWNRFIPMRDFVTLMKECWYEKPQARLSALRTRKTLGDIARFYFNLNPE